MKERNKRAFETPWVMTMKKKKNEAELSVRSSPTQGEKRSEYNKLI